MKRIKLFEEFMNEAEKTTYDSNCAMLYFDFPMMSQIHKMSFAKNWKRFSGTDMMDSNHCRL